MRLLSVLIEGTEAYLQTVVQNQQRCNRGQGVVEYAGALIISVIIVSFALAIFPNPFTAFFFDTIGTYGEFLSEYVASSL